MGIASDEAWYWFTNIKYIGRKTRNRLLEVFESPMELFEASESIIDKLSFLTQQQRRAVGCRDIGKVRKELCKVYDSNVKFLYYGCGRYPVSLAEIPDAPHALYMKGNPDILNLPSAAVVGSRNCSSYGGSTAYRTAYELALHGVSVVSGMARGIDGAAQKGCIDGGGVTCAVMGCGVDICYPESNIELYMKLQQNGCIVSEYPPGTPPLPGFFPERNRIISGLGKVLLVVEAGEKSGSLITVDCALEQGKEIFVMPGRITDKQSCGCNRLIKNGAFLFENVADILDVIGEHDELKKRIYKKSNIVLASNEEIVYAKLGLEPKHINCIVKETNLPVDVVMRILVNLELAHVARQTADSYYVMDM